MQFGLKHSALAAQFCPLIFLQTPLPSQVFVPLHCTVALLSGEPPAMFEHWPSLPARWQATQVPVQAPSQQRPSAQKPLTHSPLPPQTWPVIFLQVPVASQALFPLYAFAGLLSTLETIGEQVPRLPARLQA